jgi:CRP/FNR family transcriptional regulator
MACRLHAPLPTHCKQCPWLPETAFGGLGDEQLEFLEGHIRRATLRAGETLLVGREAGVYGVASGTVAIVGNSRHGEISYLRLVVPGEIFGLARYFAEPTQSMEARTLTDTSLCHIGRDGIEGVLRRRPGLSRVFLRSLSRELSALEEHLLALTHLTARTRLARLLTTLRESCGRPADRGWAIHLPLARQDIANLLGTRPETVARLIGALAADGVAQFNGREVSVPDPEALAREAGWE